MRRVIVTVLLVVMALGLVGLLQLGKRQPHRQPAVPAAGTR